jgi:dihydroflavonol-4-reductase
MHPGFLIGPDDYDRSLMGRVCLRFWNGRLPLVPPGGVSFVDVRDVAAGHILAAEHGSPRRRYVLGGENHTSREFTQALAAAGGVRPRLSPQLSHWGLFAVAGVLEMYYGLRGRTPFPCWQDARLQVYHWYADSTRAHRELGFRARPLAETLADSFAWHREEGLIKRRGLRRWWMRPADAHPLAGATSRLTRPRPSSPEVLSARQRTVGT